MTKVQDDGHELVLSLDPYFSQRIFCPHETSASENPRLHEKHPCLHRVPATQTLIGKVEDLEGKWDYHCTVAQCAYDSGVMDCFETTSMGGDGEGEFFRRRVGWYWTGGGEDAEMWLAFVDEPRADRIQELETSLAVYEAALEWIATGRHEAFEATSDAEWAMGMGHVAGAALGKHPLADRFSGRLAPSDS